MESLHCYEGKALVVCALILSEMWQLICKDLLILGFLSKISNPITGEPAVLDTKGLQINPLEFLACFINMRILLKFIQILPYCDTGYMIDLLSDNALVLLWRKVAAVTCNPNLQPLLLIQATHVLTHILQPLPHHSRKRQCGRGCSQLLHKWSANIMGGHYCTMHPSADLQDMPASTRAG
jgi:hypothetical protein